MDEPQIDQNFAIDLPKDRVVGIFADFASVWHTNNVFVMDFVAVAQPPTTVNNPDTGRLEVSIPGQVVQRVRIAPEQVFELAKALTQQLEAWEQETGRKPPQAPFFFEPGQAQPQDPEEQTE